jgi:hypothetical protein
LAFVPQGRASFRGVALPPPPIRAAKSHIALCDKRNFAFAQLSTVRSPSHIAL